MKSCSLDPLPAYLTSDNLDFLLPHITAIVNKSFETGVSNALKSAIVTPILKKKTILILMP